MKFNKLIVLLILISFCSNALAEEYYANIVFDVQTQGSTIISGTTNYLELTPQTTQELTSKEGKAWTFLIDTNKIFSEYSYKIILPTNAQIQNIETSGTYFIQTQNQNIIIEGFGENLTLYLKINYNLEQLTSQPTFDFLLPFLGILILIGIIYYIILKKSEITANKKLTQTFDENALTERQLIIVKQLEKNKNKITQSELQKILNLPKASIFRNLLSLEKKGIITKERKGMTMLITLQKERK